MKRLSLVCGGPLQLSKSSHRMDHGILRRRSDCDETEYFGLTLSTLIHLVAIPELFEA